MIPDKLKRMQCWCVSKDKMPLDMYALARGYEWGASNKRSHSSYTDFDTALAIGAKRGLPVTMLVDAATMGAYAIDIEKTCPKELRAAILKAMEPYTQHLERSLSKKGYHLIVDAMPADMPTAKYRKWLELLSKHHCTFTLEEVDFATAEAESFDTNESVSDAEAGAFLSRIVPGLTPEELYDLVKAESPSKPIADGAPLEAYKKVAGMFDGRHADLFGLMCDMEYQKTVDDFHGDWSSYEFGYASKLHYLLRRLCQDMIDADCRHYTIDITKEQAIMLVYMVLKQSLPPRDKHRQSRNGLPWLLYTSQQVYLKTFDK